MAGGISNFGPIFRSRAVLCLMKNVAVCATQVPNAREVSHMGIMLSRSFSSSTWVTVASLHGLGFLADGGVSGSSIIAALSKNLYINV